MKKYKQYPLQFAMSFLLVFLITVSVFAGMYLKQERKRDLDGWRSKLNIMADINETKIEEYVSLQVARINKLSSNSTLQLFLTDKKYKKEEKDDIYHAQFAHVKNLLSSKSIELGVNNNDRNAVNIKEQADDKQGIALFDSNAKRIMVSRGFNDSDEKYIKDVMNVLKEGKGRFIDLFVQEQGEVLFGYAAPVFEIHSSELSKVIGCIVVLFNAEYVLFDLIKSVHVDLETDEAVIIKQDKKDVVYLSPLKSGFEVFYKRSIEENDLASAYIASNIDGYSVKNNYRGREVLVIGRKIHNTDWILVQMISTKEALKESNSHQLNLTIIISLITVLMSVIFIAIWKHATNARLEKLTNDLEARKALLNAVSDNVKEYIFLVDETKKLVYCNLALVKDLGIDSDEVAGRSISSVLGVDVDKRLGVLIKDKNNAFKYVVTLPVRGEDREFHLSSIELEEGDYKNNRLYVLHDITEIRQEEHKREVLAKGIISTLVKAVDLHDPYCVDHSVRTRDVALAIAEEMGLDSERCETLEMASLLANIGKLFVPKEILVKLDKLSLEEELKLKENIKYAVEILKGLNFDGPVVDIISQKNEHLDGSGYPSGISREDIRLESRILAVANAFVAMASSRAYRNGKKISEVIDILLEQSDKLYDRKVVAALFHIAENKTGWDKWKDVSDFNI